ncbi:hypothetical protein T439DRAFT_328509 [Meredithblackwellia eburnea MCA 4105]
MTKGLLYVYCTPSSSLDQEEFNNWYNKQHLPDRLTFSNVKSAQRYKAVDGKQPGWLAVYELNDVEAMKMEDYRNVVPKDQELERRMGGGCIWDTRLYSLIKQWGPDLKGTPEVLQPNCMSPGEANEADQERWYDEEHNPGLMQIPGWRMCRRYKLVERATYTPGDASDVKHSTPKFLVAHWWDHKNGIESPERKALAQTPWTARVREYMEFHEGPRRFEFAFEAEK